MAAALKNDDLARIGNSQPDLAPGRHASMAAHGRVALGAALLVEPALRLDAAENALHALDRADEDVQSFALSVLVAFGRSATGEHGAARGALLALLLGSPEDTELARGELAGFVLSSAQQAIATEPTLESAASAGSAADAGSTRHDLPVGASSPPIKSAGQAPLLPGRAAFRQEASHSSAASPAAARRDPTPPTPGTMATPVGPAQSARARTSGAKGRFSIPLAIFLALVTSMLVMTIGLFVMRSHTSAAAPAASVQPSAAESVVTAAMPAATAATSATAIAGPSAAPTASVAPAPAVAPSASAPTAAAHVVVHTGAAQHAPARHAVPRRSMPSSGLGMPSSGLATPHGHATHPAAPRATASAAPKPLF